MERIVLYNVEHAQSIIKCASNMQIKSIILGDDMTSKTLKNVLDTVKAYKAGDTFPKICSNKASLVIFCDVTDKHMDRLLFDMRNGSSKVDYKAVMTKTNSMWSIRRILAQMERESKEYHMAISGAGTTK